jgi:hypothetical protein
MAKTGKALILVINGGTVRQEKMERPGLGYASGRGSLFFIDASSLWAWR